MNPFAPRQLPVPHAEVSSAQVGIRKRQNGRYIRRRHGSCVQELADKTREASVSIRGQHRRRDRKVARDVTHAAATAAADSGSPAARCAHGVFLQRAAKDFSSREHAWITPSALQCLSNARTTFFARRGRPQPMAENTRIMRCTIGAGDLAARKATKPGAVAPISR